jgi:phosphatidyl-myo-inositol dimannoside synthase
MSRKLRILFLATGVFASGGIQRFNRTLLAGCERLGVTCDALSLSDGDEHHTLSDGLSVRGFRGNRLRFARQVGAAVLTGGYDSVIVGHVHFLALVMAVRVLRPKNVPPVVLIAHGLEVWNGIAGLRRRVLRRVRQIACVSEFTRLSIHAQAPEIADGRCVLFPNALDESWARRPVPPSTSRDLPQRFLLSVTRLEPQERLKGIVTVLETLPALDPDVHYLVAGGGSDLPFLTRVAQRLGVTQRVRFLGTVTDEELAELYGRCAAFVLPSAQEGFGIVFLEAMFFGAPVIAAREKGALDVVSDGTTGLLVSFGDVVALRRAIQRLLRDHSLRDRLRAQARAAVTDTGMFTFDAFVARLATLLGVTYRTSSSTTVTKMSHPDATVAYPTRLMT